MSTHVKDEVIVQATNDLSHNPGLTARADELESQTKWGPCASCDASRSGVIHEQALPAAEWMK